jgi:hypothetical protein
LKAEHVRLYIWSVQLLEAQEVSYENAHLVALCCRSPYEYDPRTCILRASDAERTLRGP